MLMVVTATFVLASTRRLWFSLQYWKAVGIAAVIAIAAVWPLAMAYLSLQRDTGFARSLAEAREFSADWRAYFASAAYVHRWMLPLLGHWKEVLFPGFAATLLGAVGVITAWKAAPARRETVLLYGVLAIAAWWLSLGPAGGLYSALYATVPGFTLLRASSRFGLIVTFSLAVLAGFGVSAALSRSRHPAVVFVVLLGLAAAEAAQPIRYNRVRTVAPAYRVLANLPPGALIELPVYSSKFAFMRTRYMLASTAHWQPLVDAYSDFIPRDFIAVEGSLGTFPSAESFEALKRDGVRYAMFHVKEFKGAQYPALLDRLEQFAGYLNRLYGDDQMWLYEITGYP
jgi:hypothetical protein